MRLSTYTILVQTNYYLDATSIWPMGKLWITVLPQAATLFCWGLKPIPLCALNGEWHSFMGCHLHLSQIHLTFNTKKKKKNIYQSSPKWRSYRCERCTLFFSVHKRRCLSGPQLQGCSINYSFTLSHPGGVIWQMCLDQTKSHPWSSDLKKINWCNSTSSASWPLVDRRTQDFLRRLVENGAQQRGSFTKLESATSGAAWQLLGFNAIFFFFFFGQSLNWTSWN